MTVLKPSRRNPRRVILEHLRMMNSNIRTMVGVWDQRQTIMDFGGPGNPTRRKVRDDERHENQPQQWDRLAAYMDIIARQATDAARFARQQAAALRQAEQERGE